MVCTHEILTGEGGLFGQVKSVVIKIFFSRGVTLRYAPVKSRPGGGVLFWSTHTHIRRTD